MQIIPILNLFNLCLLILKRKKMFLKNKISIIALAIVMSIGPALAGTLDNVKKKGEVVCGVGQGLPGFSSQDQNGKYLGIDVDYCRALSAAIFDDPNKVRFVELSAKERFTALQSGEIDVLSRNSTWTASRDNNLGLSFVGVTYYDGQGFMVRKSLGVKSVLELSGASVCTNTGTTTEQNVADYFKANNLEYELVAFEKSNEVISAYDSNRCDVYTTDQSGLYAQRTKLANPDEHTVLPEIISKEPLGPVVRRGDGQWFAIARWVLFTLVAAEELGLSSTNVDSKSSSKSPAIKRFLGSTDTLGKQLGLSNKFAYQVVKHVGNYGEIFEKNLSGPLAIARGLNQLWSKGGLQYAPPFR